MLLSDVMMLFLIQFFISKIFKAIRNMKLVFLFLYFFYILYSVYIYYINLLITKKNVNFKTRKFIFCKSNLTFSEFNKN